MIIDAMVLAGGRSSRLGGEPKAMLEFEGETLLARTMRAAQPARRLAIVGPPLSPGIVATLPTGTSIGRETPPFGGPAAGISAGLELLRRGRNGAESTAEFTLVLACDLPHADVLVPALIEALSEAPSPSTDGVIATDPDGRPQYLAGIYRTAALEAAIAGMPDGTRDRSVRSLLESLALDPVAVPPDATDDVDTWADAARLDVTAVHADALHPPEHQGARP